MRYQENLPLVLNKISCTIRPKEKVGIVGRTGSGRAQETGLWTVSPVSLSVSPLSLCRKVIFGCRPVPAGGALWRIHPDRRYRHSRHRTGRPPQQTVHHPPRPGPVQRDGQVRTPVIILAICRIVTQRGNVLKHMMSCFYRSNLDPFNQYREEQIWDALERSHMKECVSTNKHVQSTRVADAQQRF